jgi:hypothetical protein
VSGFHLSYFALLKRTVLIQTLSSSCCFVDIALCKGLQAEGHTVRIASHGEYKEWIEGHGIEFGYVGGDPAELMRICVENGMFTVSFIKEGLQKVRLDLFSLGERESLASHRERADTLDFFSCALAVPRLDRRPPQDVVGGLPRNRPHHRESERDGRYVASPLLLSGLLTS